MELERGPHQAEARGFRLLALPPGQVEVAITPDHGILGVSVDEALTSYRCAVATSRLRSIEVFGPSRIWLPAGADLVLDGFAESWSLLISVEGPALSAARESSVGADAALGRYCGFQEDPRMGYLARTAIAHLRSPWADALAMEELGATILSRLLRAEGVVDRDLSLPGVDPCIQRALDYIRDHLGARLDLSTLAVQARMSVARFTRVFRASMGQSVWQYVQGTRCKEARRRLVSSNQPVAAIALETGFHDQAHLTKTMKTRFGATPAALRRMTKRGF